MKRFYGMGCLLLVCLMMVASPLYAADASRVLRVVSPWKAKSLDLVKSGYIFTRMGCVEMLTEAEGSGKITGQLATGWTVSNDGCTWSFSLRPDVVFHDNTPLTADAAAFSLNNTLKSKGVFSKAKVTQVMAAGPLTLKIVTSEPFSALPAYLAHYSSGIASKASFGEDGKTKEIFGTGPYKLSSFEGESLFRFTAFPDYWGEKPRIAQTEYHAVPKGETRGFMMKAGQADMAFTLSPMDAKQLATSNDVTVETLSIPRSRIITLNCNQPFFSDVRVRQAISCAINRSGIAAALLRNPPSAAAQLLPPTASRWHDANLPPLSHDPQKAKGLLAQAGWKPGKDGILVKDGKKFSFTLVTYASRPMLPPVATAVQDQLKKVGIEMNIQVGESSLIPEKHKDGSLEAALSARNFGQIPDAVGTIYGDFGPNPGAWGTLGWQSAELNTTLADYLATFEETKSKQLRNKILGILQTELPVIPVTWYEHIVAYSNQLEGVDIDPFEIKSYLRGVSWKK